MAPQTDRFLKPGIVTRADVDNAKSKLEQAEDRHDAAIDRLSEIARIVRSSENRIKANKWLLKFRKFGDDWTTRTGFLFPLVVLGSSILLPLPSVVFLAAYSIIRVQALLWIVAILSFGSVPAALAFVFRRLLFVPSDERLRLTIDELSSDLRLLAAEEAALEPTIELLDSDFELAEARYQQTLKAFESRINRLRQTNWEGMQGVEFENFLGEVFLEYGYDVQTTKVTGDQGVDLVVSNPSARAAIQAKGYPGTTVGNKAVQEAHAGAAFYDCGVAVVITNSTFTSGAIELAQKIGCVLIDKSMIPPLIEGKFDLRPSGNGRTLGSYSGQHPARG